MRIYVAPPDPQGKKLASWLLILAAIPLGLFTVITIYDKLTSRSWPTTYAEIFASDMYHSSGRSSHWCVKLRYRYVVEEKAFFSNRLSISTFAGPGCDRDKKVTMARLERYQPGALLKIRYTAANPGTAIVYTDDLDAMDFLFSGLAILMFVGGIKGIRAAATMRSPVDILLDRR
jgi:hypothetical protein